MSATYELVLWPNCKNNCTFCFQKAQMRAGKLSPFSLETKEKSISEAILFLTTQVPNGSHVMVAGGELFDDTKIFSSLKNLFEIVAYLMIEKIINEVYVNTNLIYKRMDGVIDFLEIFKAHGLLDRLHFTTSYDFDGRFRNGTEQLMLQNLQAIVNAYELPRAYVNTMLSRQACEKIISGEFSVKAFSEQYRSYINLIPYIELIPEITAPRSLIVKALQTVDNELPGYVSDYLTRLDVNQIKHVHQFNPILGEFENCSCELSSCGHSINYRRYSPAGSCYVCDMKQAFGL